MKIEQIAIEKIERDPNQPRKAFNEQKLQELAVSVEQHGIEQAITVRPHPKQAGHYMIIFGERRWRAAKIAGLEKMPVVVDSSESTTDDAAVLQRQIVENNQRDDIHPLEEGEAYQTLHKKHGVSLDDLIAKTGKSRSHIYSRMKLTELAPGVKKAMLDGRLPHAHGELIGRIPDKKLQEQCCKEVLGELKSPGFDALRNIGIEHEGINPKEQRYGTDDAQPLSFRATATLVRRRYQTKLSLATFDPADATLTKAGACGPCPQRSGNQPELPGLPTSKSDDDHCSNLECFEAKSDAQWARAAAAAKEAGVAVLDGKKAEGLFGYGGEPRSDSGYFDPKKDMPYDIVHRYENGLTWKKVLGKHLDEVPKTLVRVAGAAPVEVYDRKAALKVIEEHDLIPKKKGASLSETQKRQREAKKERTAETKLREGAFDALITQAMYAVGKEWPAGKEVAMWRFIAIAISVSMSFGHRDQLQVRRGLEDGAYPDDIAKIVNEMKHAGDLRALVIEMLMVSMAEEVVGDYGDADEAMDIGIRLFGLDWKKAELAATAEAESLKESEAAAKAVAKKSPLTDAEAKALAKDAKPAKKKGGAK